MMRHLCLLPAAARDLTEDRDARPGDRSRGRSSRDFGLRWQLWQVYHLPGAGAALPLLPFAAGVLILVTVAMRAGRDRARRPGSDQRPSPAAGERPGRRPVLKAGLLYVNRGDPAIVIAGVIAAPAGLALIRIATGM